MEAGQPAPGGELRPCPCRGKLTEPSVVPLLLGKTGVKIAETVAEALKGGDGPLQTMLWLAGAEAFCAQGHFTREAAVAVVKTACGARPLWLSEWPEGVAPHGADVLFGALPSTDMTRSVVDEALSVVGTAKGMAEASAVALTRHLSAVEETARRQSRAVRELAEVFDRSGGDASLSGSLTSMFGSLNEFRSKIATEQHSHNFLVKEAAGMVSQLTTLSGTISEFATSSKLATFNARLEAARLGEAGSGFLSIAAALFDLAKQVTAASASTTQLTTKLSRVLPQLARSSQQVKDQFDLEMARVTARVTDLKQQLATSERLARSRLDTAERDGDALSTKMSAAMAELQSADRLSQLLSSMHDAFVRAHAGEADAFDQLEAKKGSLVSDEVLASAGSIELF